MSQSLLVPNLVHNPTVSLINGNLTTTSLNVAEVFEKEQENLDNRPFPCFLCLKSLRTLIRR